MSEHLSIEALEALAASASPPAGQEPAPRPLAGEAEMNAHLRGCAACARELAWLRAELLLIARRREAQGPLPASLWDGILARVSPQAGGAGHAASSSSPVARASRSRTPAPHAAVRPPRWGFAPGRRARAAFALAAAAAAAGVVLAIALRPRAGDGGGTISAEGETLRYDLPDPAVARALDRAEGDSRAAAGVLETEYRARRSNLDAATAGSWDKSLATARSQLDSARALAGNDVGARMRILDGYAAYLRSLRAAMLSSEEAAP
jgi:hypothetical protein